MQLFKPILAKFKDFAPRQAIFSLHHPNYSNLVSNDWSDYKEQGDT